MTSIEKRLLAGMLRAQAENCRGDVFLGDFLPDADDRRQVFEWLCQFHNDDPEKAKRDKNYNEVDEYGLLLFLADRLEKESRQ